MNAKIDEVQDAIKGKTNIYVCVDCEGPDYLLGGVVVGSSPTTEGIEAIRRKHHREHCPHPALCTDFD